MDVVNDSLVRALVEEAVRLRLKEAEADGTLVPEDTPSRVELLVELLVLVDELRKGRGWEDTPCLLEVVPQTLWQAKSLVRHKAVAKEEGELSSFLIWPPGTKRDEPPHARLDGMGIYLFRE